MKNSSNEPQTNPNPENKKGSVVKEKLVEVFDKVEWEASKIAIRAVDFLTTIID